MALYLWGRLSNKAILAVAFRAHQAFLTQKAIEAESGILSVLRRMSLPR
jgi:hypothetical protein